MRPLIAGNWKMHGTAPQLREIDAISAAESPPHGETDAMVAAKATAAWVAGLRTIICIGETEPQRRAGQVLSICSKQIEGSGTYGIIAAGNAIIRSLPVRTTAIERSAVA